MLIRELCLEMDFAKVTVFAKHCKQIWVEVALFILKKQILVSAFESLMRNVLLKKLLVLVDIVFTC